VSGRQHRDAVMARRQGLAGVEEQGMSAWGPPGTWEAHVVPPSLSGSGMPDTQPPGPRRKRPASRGSEQRARGGTWTRVKRAARNDGAGVGASA
jgi:hypothetical protein